MTRHTFNIVRQPLIEPVSTAEVKLYTHISHSVEDTIIANWIKSARKEAEDFLNRAMITQIVEMSIDGWPSWPLQLPMAPLQQVITIKAYSELNVETVLYDSGYREYTNTTTTAGPIPVPTTNQYFLIDTRSQPGRITLNSNYSLPTITLRKIDSIRIQYLAGYGAAASDVPATMIDAIYLYCAIRNENRTGEVKDALGTFYNLLWPDRISIL